MPKNSAREIVRRGTLNRTNVGSFDNVCDTPRKSYQHHLLYLCFPAVGRWSLARVSLDRAWMFTVAGVVLVILGGVVGYLVWRG